MNKLLLVGVRRSNDQASVATNERFPSSYVRTSKGIVHTWFAVLSFVAVVAVEATARGAGGYRRRGRGRFGGRAPDVWCRRSEIALIGDQNWRVRRQAARVLSGHALRGLIMPDLHCIRQNLVLELREVRRISRGRGEGGGGPSRCKGGDK